MMKEAAKLESQLERLLGQDLSRMGYQACIRHQQRIEELRALRAAESPEAGSGIDREPVYAITD